MVLMFLRKQVLPFSPDCSENPMARGSGKIVTKQEPAGFSGEKALFFLLNSFLKFKRQICAKESTVICVKGSCSLMKDLDRWWRKVSICKWNLLAQVGLVCSLN